jgi:prolyl-tRNA synthetase
MKQSSLFSKARHEAPKDEVSKNAQLLIRAGYIDKLSAGIYTYLPLGLRVLKKIENIIRTEMNALGANEILMPALHPKEFWEKTGRWESMDDLYKVTDASGREFALGATHEEIVVPLAQQFISSYKDLPQAAYQIQNKFRMELRSKSGLLRGREFIMKDLYSFHTTEEDLNAYYEKTIGAYKAIFEKAGLGENTFVTYASGGSFAQYSHEFQTLTDAGEDIIYLCKSCNVAVNKEIAGGAPVCPECKKTDLSEEKAVEVGNIFKLKTKYSEPFGLTYKDAEGKENLVIMGCYGIGLGRLVGTIAEIHSDEKGLVWPKSVAPFQYHILLLSKNDEQKQKAEALYKDLTQKGIEVLFDDRMGMSAGAKFAEADVLGIPEQIIVGDKMPEDGTFEIKNRKTGAVSYAGMDELYGKE